MNDARLSGRAPPTRGPDARAPILRGPLIGTRSVARWLLVVVLAASAWFFHGFLAPVLAAMIIAFATWPLHERLQSRLGIGRMASGSILVLTILLFLVTPLVLAAAYAAGEVRIWVDWAAEVNRVGAPNPTWIAAVPGAGEWLAAQWNEHIGRPGAIAEFVELASGETLGSLYRGILTVSRVAFDFILALLFMLITLFVFYRDGERIAAQIDRVGERVLDEQWERISRVVPRTISSTVTGMTVIAIGEGIILGAAYWIAGAPSPITLGIITGFMALMPGGAPLAMSLVSIYLFASGAPGAAIGLFLWGALELFIVDKTVRPTLVGGPIKLPFLPTFFGLIGGVKTMGLVGLFVGPVLMALLVAIWREWVREIGRTGPPPAP
jgi:predicted PurR-regulated permease PerM